MAGADQAECYNLDVDTKAFAADKMVYLIFLLACIFD